MNSTEKSRENRVKVQEVSFGVDLEGLEWLVEMEKQ